MALIYLYQRFSINSCISKVFSLLFCLFAVVPAMIVVITVLAEPQSYGFHVMDKNNETL